MRNRKSVAEREPENDIDHKKYPLLESSSAPDRAQNVPAAYGTPSRPMIVRGQLSTEDLDDPN